MNETLNKILPSMEGMKKSRFKLYALMTFFAPISEFFFSINKKQYFNKESIKYINLINPKIDFSLISLKQFNYLFNNMLMSSFLFLLFLYLIMSVFFYFEKKWALKTLKMFIKCHLWFLVPSALIYIASDPLYTFVFLLFSYMHLIVLKNFKVFYPEI